MNDTTKEFFGGTLKAFPNPDTRVPWLHTLCVYFCNMTQKYKVKVFKNKLLQKNKTKKTTTKKDPNQHSLFAWNQ